MSETSLSARAKILAFAAMVEGILGLLLIFDPAWVISLLLGAVASGVGIPIARCFGVALLALALACWPGGSRTGRSSAFRAVFVYNASIAPYLVYLGAVEHLSGLLLWPAVVLHAVVALSLAGTWGKDSRAE
jgi:hypothetical protein